MFSRSLKTIPLSEQALAALASTGQATPTELMQAILKAPADLLWFGGIGTLSAPPPRPTRMRATAPTTPCGSPARNCGEGDRRGPNLGLTQRGRIEAARAGIRLNTDAIDNSAGVNTSDVEVNIKIAGWCPARRAARLRCAQPAPGRHDRRVGGWSCATTSCRPRAVARPARRPRRDRLRHAHHAGAGGRGRLDRAVEYLPTMRDHRRMRRGEGLTRPNTRCCSPTRSCRSTTRSLASTVPNDPYFDRELQRYFPKALREQFPDAVKGHRLRREIISTALANIIVNRRRPSLVTRLVDGTGRMPRPSPRPTPSLGTPSA